MENKNTPLVAIGVPVYNGEKYLFECLESILNQNYQNWECVVIDNQSTDKTNKIALEFEKRDKRFKVIRIKEFVPLVDNWNNAFMYANQNAKYYKLLQADDWMFHHFIEENVKLFETDPTVGVISSYRLAGTKVDCCGLDINNGRVFNGKEILFKQLTKKIDISGDISTLIFSFEYLKKLPYFPRIFDGKYHIDTELFYDLLDISNVGFVFQVLSYTRRHPDSQTNQVVFKYNTFLQLNEAVLYRTKRNDILLNRLYRKLRIKYAYFYTVNKFKRNKAYEWHKKHIDRWFTNEEYLIGILVHNPLSNLLWKIFRRVSRTFGNK
jgi:glycosyltransferase involved in cell wall biosynthesis